MVYQGNKDVAAAGTAEALLSVRTPATWILMQAKNTNTGAVYVGGADVSSTNGVRLLGDDSLLFPPVADLSSYDLSATYVDVDNNGDGVKFTHFRR